MGSKGTSRSPPRFNVRLDRIAATLQAQGIPTAIFYPKPIHVQSPYRGSPMVTGGLPVTERLAQDVICLPMHPYLDEATQDRVIATVLKSAG